MTLYARFEACRPRSAAKFHSNLGVEWGWSAHRGRRTSKDAQSSQMACVRGGDHLRRPPRAPRRPPGRRASPNQIEVEDVAPAERADGAQRHRELDYNRADAGPNPRARRARFALTVCAAELKKERRSPAAEAKRGPSPSGRRAVRLKDKWHICHRLEHLWHSRPAVLTSDVPSPQSPERGEYTNERNNQWRLC